MKMLIFFFVSMALFISCSKKKEIPAIKSEQEPKSIIENATKDPPVSKVKQFEVVDHGKVYVVRIGDTFSEICQSIKGCGRIRCWRLEAKRLGLRNPHLIFPGDRLIF